MSVAEYLENIKGKLQRLPQITRQQRKGSKKLGEDARRMYAKLVQAFGWSAGATADVLAKPSFSLRSEGLLYTPRDRRASAKPPKPVTQQPATRSQRAVLVAGIHSRLHVKRVGPRQLFFAFRIGTGGRTKGFETDQGLFDWVADTYGEAWKEQLKLKG